MATTVQSLFGLTPEQVQAQRATDLEARALQYSQMNPFQRAEYGIFKGASQLGDVLAERLGYVDPQVKAAQERQGILGGLDMNDPQALLRAAQAMQQRDPQAAQALLDRVSKLRSDESEKLKGMTQEQKNSAAWADSVAMRGTPEWADAYKGKLQELTTKEGARINYGNEAEIASRALFGKNFNELTPTQAEAVRKELERAGVTKAKAGATTVSQVVTNKAAEAFGSKFGQLTGEQAAQVTGKYTAIENIQEAMNLLDTGIYAGQWGPEKMLVAKATGGLLGDQKKVENTEAFLSYVGNIVIPRLQDFGGNDSVEELRYLRSVLAGDQRLEPASMKRILQSAEKSINKGIERLKKQASTVGASGMVVEDTAQPSAPKTATKRFNPATGRLEEIR